MNPAPYRQPAPAPREAPPEVLLAIKRNDSEELRLTRQTFNGHPFLGLRIWFKAADGAFYPTPKGVSIRYRDARKIAEALLAVAPKERTEAEQSPQIRELARPRPPSPFDRNAPAPPPPPASQEELF